MIEKATEGRSTGKQRVGYREGPEVLLKRGVMDDDAMDRDN